MLTQSLLVVLATAVTLASPTQADEPAAATEPVYQVHPIGWIRKHDGKTTIVVNEKYRPALMGVDELSSIWVLYWFDRNDTPEKRAIHQVHPRNNPANPLRGVFATRAPVRPSNSQCVAEIGNDERYGRGRKRD